MSTNSQERNDLAVDICSALEKVFKVAIQWEWRIHRAKPGDVINGVIVTASDLELALGMTTTMRKQAVEMLKDSGYDAATLRVLGEAAIAELEAKV